MSNKQTPEINEHISKYLDYYFDLPNKPYYAVMLSGEWGCGKTWFIKKIIDERTPKKKTKKADTRCEKIHLKWIHLKNWCKKKTENSNAEEKGPFIYISLYGMKDVSEIDTAIFQSMHSVLASKFTTLLKSAVSGAASKYIFIKRKHFFDMFSNMANSSIDKIMIFDDAERCHIPHEELFGYLNRFVEHRGQKVVLVAHEDELFVNNKEDNAKKHTEKIEDNTKKYVEKIENNTKKYKEKIIGATFHLEASVDVALPLFIHSVDKKHRELLLEYKETILLVYNKVKQNNLRNLRQAVLGFSRFLEQFPNGMIEVLENRSKPLWSHYGEDSGFEYIVRFYFFLFLEEKGTAINNENWKKAISLFNSTEVSYTVFLEADKSDQSDLLEYLDSFGISQDILFGDDWYNAVILNMDYSSKLSTIFDEMAELERTKPKAVWVLVERLPDLLEEEFTIEYNKLLSDVLNNKIQNIGELFHSFGMLLHLSKKEIIRGDIETIEETVRNNLKTNLNNGKYKIIKNISSFTNWAGYTFYEHGSSAMEKMIKDLYQIQNEIETHKLTGEFKKLISNLKDNLDTICEGIFSYGKFYNEPFFSKIEKKEDFFNSVLSLQAHKMYRFMHALKKRYRMEFFVSQINKKLLDEADFIAEFHSFIDKEKKKITVLHNPITIRYSNLLKDLLLIKNQLKKAKEKFKENEDKKS